MDNSPVEQRAARYDYLFRGEDPYDPIPDDALVGLSGLCRVARKSGTRSKAVRTHLDTIPGFVQDVLLEHDIAAIEDEDSEAVFAFADDEARIQVSNAVTEVFRLWELTNDHHHLDMLISPSNSETKWLIVETAAAVMQAFYDTPYDYRNPNDVTSVARIVANWGPLFARKWFNGQIIEEWGHANAFTRAEIAEWQQVFTPSTRKRFAVSYVADPLDGLRRVKANLEVPLSTANIAATLEWSEQEVETIFNPAFRKELAIRNINHPTSALIRIKDALETILTTSNIAEQLGWTEAEVDELFTLSVKKSLAIDTHPLRLLNKFISNLTEKLHTDNLAAELQWPADQIEDLFTARVKKHIALNYRDYPLSAAKKVAHNFTNVLTTEKIAEKTGKSHAEVNELFKSRQRKQFAVYYIDHPLDACVDLLEGRIVKHS